MSLNWSFFSQGLVGTIFGFLSKYQRLSASGTSKSLIIKSLLTEYANIKRLMKKTKPMNRDTDTSESEVEPEFDDSDSDAIETDDSMDQLEKGKKQD